MVEAESLLLAARDKYIHNADIEGFLGFVYRGGIVLQMPKGISKKRIS